MPFTTADVEKHIQGLGAQQKAAWVRIANRVLEDCDGDESTCDARAIRVANAQAKKIGEHYELWNDDELIESLIRAELKRDGGPVKREDYPIHEFFAEGEVFSESHVDRRAGVIGNVKLLGQVSKNGHTYSDRALNDAARLYEGVKFFIDHPPEDEMEKRNNVRSVLDLAGRVANVRRAGHEVRGDLQILNREPTSSLIFALAEQMPDAVGNSHRAIGTISQEENGAKVVESIEKVISVDLVTDPATTNGLFESITKKETTEMKDLTLEKLRAERPDLVEQITAEADEGKEVETLREENKNLKAKVDEYEVKEKEREREKEIEELIDEAKLPDRVVTDLFLDQLREAEDREKMVKLIEERAELAKGLPKPGPKSNEREVSFDEGKEPIDESRYGEIAAEMFT